VTEEGGRIAFAVLSLGHAEPVVWTDEVSYGVDAGVACFTSPRALAALAEASAAYYGQEKLIGDEPLVDAFAGRDAIVYEATPGQAMAVFESGVGDGEYSAWIGRDERGLPAVVLTSFDTVAAQSTAA
jgi:hypothetical protein